MADTKISQLTAAGSAQGTDEYVVNQGGVTKKLTGDQFAAYLRANLGAATGTSLALGGATLGSNVLAVTGNVLISGTDRATTQMADGGYFYANTLWRIGGLGESVLSYYTSAAVIKGAMDFTVTDELKFSNTTNAGPSTMRFGTHSAIAAETVTGYITVKDWAGNVRKLAVVS